MNIQTSKSLFERAKKVIPGGVNSPVRAFKAVGGDPIFFCRAEGAYLYDEDGNEYIDMINSWGPMILGHANKYVEEAIIKAVIDSPSFGAPSRMEVDIAELIVEMIPSIEKVRMVNSGTEATMSAIRLARGYTGRDKFIKFEGCYHGHGDAFLIAAGSGAVTMGEPDSLGVTPGTAKDTLPAKYNDLEGVAALVASNKDQVAAIIIEPVAGNMGCIVPQDGFLAGLRKLCDENGIVLIFDEVMTGFRLSAGGAQQILGVQPDMTTLGKIIGGGMPVGAYGGKKELMDFVSPQGPVYQAGTLSGNPVAMAAGLAVLTQLNDNPNIYKNIEKYAGKMSSGYKKLLKKYKKEASVNQIGSMFTLFFTPHEVRDFEGAKACDMTEFGHYFNHMLKHGIYLAPSQYESLFLSSEIQDAEVRKILNAFEGYLKNLERLM